MKIALGSDHRGSQSARSLKQHLESEGHDVTVCGDCTGVVTDYPDHAWSVSQAITSGSAQFGILICGSGIGMSIAANKVPGIRAALVSDELTAELSRAHNDANVLCLSGDLIGQHLIQRIVDTWLATSFEGGRHARRVGKLALIEQGQDPSGRPAETTQAAAGTQTS